VARRAGGNAAPAAAAAATSGAKGEHAAGPEWYRTNVEYWDAQAPTDNGVLGGFGFVADVDIRDSAAFLLKVGACGVVCCAARLRLSARCCACDGGVM
jgi:hypothetical protein